MHRSRLGQIIIDCQASDLTEAAQFWSNALGRPVGPAEKPASEKYVTLGSGEEDIRVALQKVDHPSRVHLDIEADNIEREAARLERLGAKRIARIESWWVMEAPTGHRFCVTQPQHERLPDDANSWA
jgi:predicted enzyme related to lactoylglutathione lyase